MERNQKSKIPTDEEKEKLFQNILDSASQSGYNLNPDKDYCLFLMGGLLTNESRYGYQGCPCRLSSGVLKQDLDIICPCDYRDPDLSEFGMCYCSLYVTKEVVDGKKETRSIPERRVIDVVPDKKLDDVNNQTVNTIPPSTNGSNKTTSSYEYVKSPPENINSPIMIPLFANIQYPVWRCKVCGYLCARGEPPELCPICKAIKERFERFL